MTTMDPMDQAEIGALTSAQFADLLAKLLAVPWPVPADRVATLTASWGWPVAWEGDEGACEADPGYRLDTPHLADFRTFEGELMSIVVGTADYVSEPTDASHAGLDDVFARYAAVARDRVGPPDRRRSGATALAFWDLPDGALLVVGHGARSSWVEVVGPQAAEVRRRTDAHIASES